jgi:glucose-1-phosphate cytidylyltransferase
MKVIILAGGLGTRLSEYTDVIPKPMVSVGERPIIWHIMQTFANHGHKDFYLALGYKSQVLKDYFLKYHYFNSDFTIDLSTGNVECQKLRGTDWRVTLVETGDHTMTGGRVKRLQEHIGDEPFFLTYGDGLANVNINNLLEFHRKSAKIMTVTAVRPIARFGELSICSDMVLSFKEKPQLGQGWINGGYFVAQPELFDFIEGDSTILEREPLESLAESRELAAFRHEGFWQCMDTKRDLDALEELWRKGDAPWTL